MKVSIMERPRWLWWVCGGFLLFALMVLSATSAFAQSPVIQYVSHTIIYDTINGDGVANPGEFVYLTVTIRNTGTITAFDVSGSLQTASYEATCYDVGKYGNLGPGEEREQVEGALYFHLSPLTPDGRVIDFTLELFDDFGNYYSVGPFSIPVVDTVGPVLIAQTVSPKLSTSSGVVTLTATLHDGAGVAAVTTTVRSADNSIYTEFAMYDDGLHGDGAAGDRTYGAVWTTPSVAYDFVAGFKAVDNLGYSREYADETGFTTRSFSRLSNILLVIDDMEEAGFDEYYTTALGANGFAYDLWYTFFRGPVPESVTLNYLPCIVIWAVPERGVLNDPEDPSARNTLMSYLDNGGKLFVTGQDIGYYIHHTEFYTGYLHAHMVQDNIDMHDLRGVTGDEIGDGLSFTIAGTGTGAGNQSWPDEISPIAPAQRVFEYYNPDPGAAATRAVPTQRDSGASPSSKGSLPARIQPQEIMAGGAAALRVETEDYKVVYFGFGFEGIDEEADRNAVMKAVVGWLHGYSNFEKLLLPGWNLLSLPVIPDYKAITEVLASIAGKYSLVQAYEAVSATWTSYDPNLPPEASQLLALDEKTPFWINMNETGTLALAGLLPIYTEQTLVEGWNLVSYPASEPRAVATALSSISGKYTQMLRYEAGEATLWKRYNSAIPPWANSLTQMSPGWGYWLYVTEACTLAILN
jgi:hypothetical protein